MDRELQDATRTWLTSFDWTYFITVTFRWWADPLASHQHMGYVYRALSREYPDRVFLGTELHEKGDLHIHGLYAGGTNLGLTGLRPPSATELWDRLFRRFGMSKVSPIRNKEAVVNYTTKYVTKGLTDWNIW